MPATAGIPQQVQLLTPGLPSWGRSHGWSWPIPSLVRGWGVEIKEEGGEKNVGEKIARGKVQGQTDTWLQETSIPVSS